MGRLQAMLRKSTAHKTTTSKVTTYSVIPLPRLMFVGVATCNREYSSPQPLKLPPHMADGASTRAAVRWVGGWNDRRRGTEVK